MAQWLKHPAYLAARDRLVARLQNSIAHSWHLPPIVFLCGAHRSERREQLAAYLRRHNPHVRFFYAEHVWHHIARLKHLNALQMEEQLARLADMIIIVVESPGTFAELGAFASNSELRKKLLPIVDRRYEQEESFINTGPVRWTDEESRFGPTIFADFDPFLLVADQVVDRIGAIQSTGRPLKEIESLPLAERPKHLLYLLCDIVAIVGPTTSSVCIDILQAVLGGKNPLLDVPTLLGLAETMDLIQFVDEHDDGPIYHRPPINGVLEPYLHKRMFDLGLERARFIGTMQKVPGHWASHFEAGVRKYA